jgi:enoyl-CoA hydratase/carnithine racemase
MPPSGLVAQPVGDRLRLTHPSRGPLPLAEVDDVLRSDRRRKKANATKNQGEGDSVAFDTLSVNTEGAVLFTQISAPPMNLLGPELVRDVVSLIQRAEADDAVKVIVFKSADPDYFISHVDVTRIAAYRDATATLTGGPSLGLMFRYRSASRFVAIAHIEDRVRGAGSEFVVACDMRFAARESAIFGQPEVGFGLVPGAGGLHHLTRLMGRGRALEAIVSGEDHGAELAERYGGSIERSPADELGNFVNSLAHRIAKFPTAALVAIKERVNAVALATAEDLRRDSDLFLERARSPEGQSRSNTAMTRGFQTRGAKLNLARMLEELE